MQKAWLTGAQMRVDEQWTWKVSRNRKTTKSFVILNNVTHAGHERPFRCLDWICIAISIIITIAGASKLESPRNVTQWKTATKKSDWMMSCPEAQCLMFRATTFKILLKAIHKHNSCIMYKRHYSCIMYKNCQYADKKSGWMMSSISRVTMLNVQINNIQHHTKINAQILRNLICMKDKHIIQG